MKKLAALLLVLTAAAFADVANIAPTEAAQLVADSQAVLVDVREAAEWNETGVAAPALLLAKSDYDSVKKDWRPFLDGVGSKTIILYCRSGNRSGKVAAALAELGYKTANAGGFKDWQAAGLPTRKP
ncbi:MAG: rhodanese-like domain-containing protein [Limisphaerales bacterium]